jgi:hypothetical protein
MAQSQPLAASSITVSVDIYVAVSNSLTPQRTIPITGEFTEPGSGVVEAASHDTLNFSGSLTAGITGDLQWPTPSYPMSAWMLEYNLSSSGYGWRRFRDNTRPPDGTLDWELHGGIDIAVVVNTSVYAAADGKVSAIGDDGATGRGKYVELDHGDGVKTVYYHLNIIPTSVTRNSIVVAGVTIIGLSGNTGDSTGPHLHFGCKVNGQTVNPVYYLLLDTATLEQYLQRLAAVVVINGVIQESTKREFTGLTSPYSAPLDLSAMSLQTGQEYPLQIWVISNVEQKVLYDGVLRLRYTALRTVLTWDKADTDVDTHVYDSHGNHAWYGNLNGIPGASLDHDDTDGFGPETFSMEQMEPDTTYAVDIHYYSDHGNGPTTATMKVQLGEQIIEVSEFLSNHEWARVGTYPMAPNAPFGALSAMPNWEPFCPDPVHDPYLVEIPGVPNIRFRLIPK